MIIIIYDRSLNEKKICTHVKLFAEYINCWLGAYEYEYDSFDEHKNNRASRVGVICIFLANNRR